MPDTISPKAGKFLACACILASEILERVAFYAFLAGLVVFLNGEPINWTEINALNLTFVFLGVSYSAALAGSFLADVCIGRFWAIFIGFVLYLGGYICWVALVKLILQGIEEDTLPAMCHPSTVPNTSEIAAVRWRPSEISDYISYRDHDAGHRIGPRLNLTRINDTAEWLGRSGMPSWSTEVCSWPIVLIVCVIGFGVGIVRTNLAPYGAYHWTGWKTHNQNNASNANEVIQQGTESSTVRGFFSAFFFASSAGSLLAIGVLTYFGIKVESMFGAAVGAVACLALAFVIFLFGRLWYVRSNEKISRDTFFACIRAACCWGCRRRQDYREIRNESIETVVCTSNKNAREQVAEDQRALEHQEQQQQQEAVERTTDRRRFWYLAVISLVLIPYWTIHHQMLATFPFQALHMNIKVDEFPLPVPWMYLTEAVVIVIMIPLIYGVILPHMESRPVPRTISMRARMIIGIIFAILSIVAAGLLELFRRERYFEDDGKMSIDINKSIYYAAKMSVFLQIPQYLLVGIGDAFSNVAGLELIYSQTPDSMRGIALGIFWLFSGCGSFLSYVLTVIGYHQWIFDWDDGSPNCEACKWEIHFFIQAGLAFVCLVLFCIFTSCCKIGISHKYDRTERQPAQGGMACDAPQDHAHSIL